MSYCVHLSQSVWLVRVDGWRAVVAAASCEPLYLLQGKGPDICLWEAAEPQDARATFVCLLAFPPSPRPLKSLMMV